MKSTSFWIAVDSDGSKWGWGATADDARADSRRDYIELLVDMYGPFRRMETAADLEVHPGYQLGDTTWTDGDCKEDSPEAVASWAAGLTVAQVHVESRTAPELALGVAAVMGWEGRGAVRAAKRLIRTVRARCEPPVGSR